MKIKVIVITTVLAIIFGQVAITFPLLTDSSAQSQTELNSQNFTLIKEFGEIFYKKYQESTFVPVEEDVMELPMNTYVKTMKGNAHILLPDDSLITLSENTELHVFMQDNKPGINQFLGKTWYRIKHLTGIVEDRVYTPSVTVSVRGTVFNVEVNDAVSTDVFNSEGSVEVKKLDNSGKYNDKQILTTGMIAKVEDDKLLVSQADDKYLADPWIKQNVEIDEKWHTVDSKQIAQEIMPAITKDQTAASISKSSQPTKTNEQANAAQVSSSVQTNEISNTQAEKQTYTIKSGDTLWGIAQMKYGNGFEWKKIRDANLNAVYLDNKGQQTLIITGTQLVLP